MKKISIITEIIIFVLLTCFVLHVCYGALRYRDTGSGGGFDNFYAADVPIDLMIYGSSHAACTVNNAILWQDYGIPAYSLTAGGQTCYGTYEFMRESFKHNIPKVALIETYMLANDAVETDSLYRTALTPRWSPRYAASVIKYSFAHRLPRQNAEELAFKMPIVHSRYAELNRSDFYNADFYNMGYRGSNETNPVDPPAVTDERIPLPDSCREYIDRMITLCRRKNVSPVFFNAPCSATAEDMAYQNSIKDLLESYDVPYIGFAADAAMYGIDYNTDMREYSHMNDTGAAKVTNLLGEYFRSEYDLPDRRGQSGYGAWDLHARYQNDRSNGILLRSCDDIGAYLGQLASMRDEYTLIISLNGEYRVLGDEPVAPGLEAFGIDRASYEAGGVWVIRAGAVDFASGGAVEYRYHHEPHPGSELDLHRSEDELFGHIRLDDADLSCTYNGISITVYDEQCLYTVDSIYMDLYSGTEIRRF